MTKARTTYTSDVFHIKVSNVFHTIICHNWADIYTVELVRSQQPVIIGAAPGHDSHHLRGKRMFCNHTTDRLGPMRVESKAATRVKKKKTVAKSPKELIIDDSDEVPNAPENSKRALHSTKSRATYPHKHIRVFSSDPSKKQPSVISLLSDSTSSPTSNYEPKDDIKMEGGGGGGSLDSEASSVGTEYEQASTSCKRKLKVMPPARKAKRVAAEDLGEELPPVKPSKGKQPALAAGQKRGVHRFPTSPPSSDKESALPHKQDAQLSGADAGDGISERHTRPPAVPCIEPSSAEDPPFYTAISHPAPSQTRGTCFPSHLDVSCN